jgi:hypothetical protein
LSESERKIIICSITDGIIDCLIVGGGDCGAIGGMKIGRGN